MKKLLLLHGWGMSPSTWHGVTHLLSNVEADTLALPGYCGSAAPDPYTLENLADAVLAEQTGPVALCGWSLGAMIAMVAAARHPKRVSHLILIGATPSFVQREEWPDAIDQILVARLDAAVRLDAKSALKRFILMLNQNDIQAGSISRELTNAVLSGELPPQSVLQAGLELLQRTDIRSLASAIRQPALVIHGARDNLMPVAAASWLQQSIPAAKLEVFADAAHAPHLSDPARCAGLITAFLAADFLADSDNA